MLEEVVKSLEKTKAAWHPWDDTDPEGLQFCVRALTEVEKSAIPVFNETARRKQSAQFDWRGYAKKFCRMAIIEWKGMKIKHLPEILDMSKSSLDAADMEKDVPFTEKEKEFILDRMNGEFSDWVSFTEKASAKHGKELEKN